ncbi:MAG: hypothetical protein EZS28_027906 [Streblomastix strix]|uniref:Protein kinase domain-containing protein n=1 Tax=Streblomastix strix TaxID=222440 RepID=A0A5J4V1I0_9EUKA|nr:MAG: hypothetical protein EZS28_027906 [Streblomastix strix]
MASKSYLHAAGTQNYSAPETDENKMTAESDVWSIGVIIIEVITGIHPFQGLTQNQTLSNIANGKYKAFPDYIQGELRMMIESMISKDYKKRPTVKSLLETETMQLVGMIEKSKEQKGSEQENEQMSKRVNELEMKVRSLEVEKESEKQEKLKEKRDKEKAITEKDQEKRRADLAISEKDRLQVKLNREKQEKERAQVELNRTNALVDLERRRADSALNEVTRLTTENQQLKAQLKLTPVPTQKPKQALLQVTSSAQAITVNLEVPSGMHGHKDANRFTHDDTVADCTISTDPIISEGIVYCEYVFKKHDRPFAFGIGITDSSVVFKPNKSPFADEYEGKTVCYWDDGQLIHINFRGPSNQGFVCGQRIGAEVNMISRPRRLTFFVNDVEQQYYVINIPEAIRFYSYIHYPNSSFTVTRFERRSSSSAHGVTGSIGLEWRKQW